MQISTSWPGSHFPLACIWNTSIYRVRAMGVAGRAIGMQGVLKGAPLFSLWRLAMLFFSMWELDAQTAVETRPMYIWQTGTVEPLCSFRLNGRPNLALLVKYSYANIYVQNTIHNGGGKLVNMLLGFLCICRFSDGIKSSCK